MKANEKNTTGEDIFSKLNSFFEKNENTVFYVTLGLSVLFSLLLFNLRISEGGDDSTYIIRAYDLIKEGKYPSFQGPLYPIFLSLIVAVSGIKIGLMKLFSLFFMIIFFMLFHEAFRRRIESVVLYPALLLLSVNSYLLYFSSQTYAEAMFLAILGWFFVLFFRYLDPDDKRFKDTKALALIALSGLILVLTKTIGGGVVIAAALFFVLNRDYKKAGMFLLFFFVFMGVWMIFKGMIWGFDAGSASSQATTLIYKHPYDFSQGKETFSGYLGRIVDNSNLYLSKNFLKMLGFRNPVSLSHESIYTVAFYLLFIFTFLAVYKKNRYMYFTGIFLITLLGITFVSLQKIWDQFRLIIPFFPFMVLFLFKGIIELFRSKHLEKLKFLVPVFISLTILFSAGRSIQKMDLMTLRSNIKGNKFKGYTDDWANYLKMAEFVGKNLGEDTFVACRKPNMARLYSGGKKFYGIYRFNTKNPDSLLKRLEDKHVTHIIMASLRKNPMVNNGMTINTVKRYMSHIVKKYPRTFILQHKIGASEPAWLFKIDYSKKLK